MLEPGSWLLVVAPGQASPREQRQQEAKDHRQQEGVLVWEDRAGLSPEQVHHAAPPHRPPWAHFQAAQGRCPRYHPTLACHRRAEPSPGHSGSCGYYCKPAEEKRGRSHGIRDLRVSPPTFQATHPMAMAGDQATLQLPEGSVLAAPLLAHLWAVVFTG